MRWITLRKGGGYATILTAALATLSTPIGVRAEPQAPARGQQQADFQKLLDDKTPAIVTVKYVLKTKARWGESESEREVTGALIAADGLVLCANSQLGGGPWLRGSGSAAIPTDIKILIGDDTEGLDAKLIARDSELDLAWLRVGEPGEKKLPFISLRNSAKPEIGERIYSVTRLAKYFDRVPVVREARLGGVAQKPRKLFVPSGGSASPGLPVYNAKGQVIGVSVSQMPDAEEMESAGGFLGGGFFAGALILPADEVRKATERALESARDEEDEEEEAAGEDDG